MQRGLAEAIVRSPGPNQDLLSLGAGLLFWTWQTSPLDMPVAAMLTTLDKTLGFLSPDCRELLNKLKRRSTLPPGREQWLGLKEAGDSQAKALFMERALNGHGGQAWLDEMFEELIGLEDFDLADRLLGQASSGTDHQARLAAELAWHQGRTEKALALAESLANTPFAAFGAYLAGHLLASSGQARQGADVLARLWRAMPWHANLTLKLHDLANPPATLPLAGQRAAILVYTWNKARLAEQTLDSLFASRIGDNPVFVLDNGSSDHTPEVLAAKQEVYGQDRLRVIRLPVNIGAPAARNWLLSLPEVRGCRFAAFLDDDVILPPDWLDRLTQAALGHPECGTVGCAVRDAGHPHRLQSADYHIMPGPPGEKGGEDQEDRIRILNNCTGELDTGMFDYQRPCLSVSGCCHMLNLAALDQVGGFDVRFSPTQFDDLDRDMRSWLAGRPCFYDGGLKIGHVQRSSLRQARDLAAMAHVLGNKLKLEAKFDDQQLRAVIEGDLSLAWSDLLAKQAVLRHTFFRLQN